MQSIINKLRNAEPMQRFGWISIGVIAVFIVSLMIAGVAKAADKGGKAKKAEAAVIDTSTPNWTGCYVSAVAGGSAMDIGAGISVAGVGTLLSQDGLGGSGGTYGVAAGCDYRTGRLVFGGGADWLKHQGVDWTLGIAAGLGGPTIKTGLDNQWSVFGRAGYLINERTLAYGKVAYSQLEMDPISAVAPGTAISIGLPKFKDWAVGGGLEVFIAPNLSLKGEYMCFNCVNTASESVALAPNVSLAVEPIIHTGTLSLSYKFNALPKQ